MEFEYFGFLNIIGVIILHTIERYLIKNCSMVMHVHRHDILLVQHWSLSFSECKVCTQYLINQERSARILWNIVSRMCGEGSEHIKSTKKLLCQNSVAYAKSPWNLTKVLRRSRSSNSEESSQLRVSCWLPSLISNSTYSARTYTFNTSFWY